ncbi:hypothetical protein A2954_01600 [Candidatus Roizmanbacteria bacterium RIFCSPLOWO2_01_FULL_37_12]|uniref:Uncharacterized protein n=1 Tax=Candidatus Roizmanbacteria bacterium RIFCSPLOWO2_01_FULL_37_12 TaxID=1802056 RepID=A0A1F7IA13_9BACT|nr:MAG: hypothetical protein A3D76_05500 [Candidatus Roizmanbacteria bacterium RIFCSPHIGHO2_02_FULL_37_9b]OGK40190.1 MAG: hypothetical protein A2954_01600 [Candidatus Roizmanbacteria bacterium RIFCSPLOWO2_01_FULL_37_12]
MRNEIKFALSSLLTLALACESQASLLTPSVNTAWIFKITACLEEGIPDGVCTVGQNGDKALQIDVSLMDLSKPDPYAITTTNPDTGEATLSSNLPEGYSPQLGYPSQVPVTGGYARPYKGFIIVNRDGTNIEADIPYALPVEGSPQQSG